METCQLIIKAVPDPLYQGVFHHVPDHYEGDIHKPMIVSHFALAKVADERYPKQFTMLGLTWRQVDFDMMRGDGTYVCVTPWPFRWMIWRASVLTGRVWHRFKARAIMTLHVWGLAYVPGGEMPSLSHIGKRRPC